MVVLALKLCLVKKEVCGFGRNTLGQVFYFWFLTHLIYKPVNFDSLYSYLVVNYGKHLPLPVKSRGKVLSTNSANVCMCYFIKAK